MARFGKSSFLQHRYRRPAQRSLHPDPGFFVRRAPRPVAAAGVSKLVRGCSKKHFHCQPTVVATRFKACDDLPRPWRVVAGVWSEPHGCGRSFQALKRAATPVADVFRPVFEPTRPWRGVSGVFLFCHGRGTSLKGFFSAATRIVNFAQEQVATQQERFVDAGS